MSVSPDQFAKSVVIAGLTTAEEVKTLWSSFAAGARPKDGESFAKLLIERGTLTEFQAEELLSGRKTPLVLGDYVLLEKIGAGGMGQVFKARHNRMKRLVAIKLLPPSLTQDEAAIKRFEREVEAAAKLAHPNIVQAYDASLLKGIWYLVMEYVAGRDLASIVTTQGPLPIDQTLDYLRQAARGLAFAHSRGVIHRDIKPANLLLDQEGTVKILDMGLARVDGAPQDGLTQSGQVMGTVDYMAPEQAFDTHKADGRADIYSLGCTLFRLLTNKNMYDGETMIQKLMGHQTKPIPSLTQYRDDVSPAVVAVFERMVAKLPEERYQTMTEVESALSSLLTSPSSQSLAPSPFSIQTQSGSNVSVKPANTTATTPAADGFSPTVSISHPSHTTDPVSERSIQVARVQPIAEPLRKKKSVLPIIALGGGVVMSLFVVIAIGYTLNATSGPELVQVKSRRGIEVNTSEQPNSGTTTANDPDKKNFNDALNWAVKGAKAPVASNNPPTVLPPKPTPSDGPWPFDPQDGKAYVWSAPENLGPNVNTANDELSPTLTADELRLVFHAPVPMSAGTVSLLWECIRSSTNEPFGPRVQLKGSSYEAEPALSADGLTLLYDSHAVPMGRLAKDIRLRQRETLDAPWNKSTTVSLDGDNDEQTPWLSPDGLTLLYAAVLPNSVSNSRDLWLAKRTSLTEPWGTPVSVGNGINTDKSEMAGQLLAEGQFLVFNRDSKPFLAQLSPDGNTVPQALPDYIRGAWLSNDGQRLYFHNKDLPDGFGGEDLWMIRRVPKETNAAWNTPEFQTWVADVRKLSAEKQLEAVSQKLVELNPSFDGKLVDLNGVTTPKIENDVVTEVYLPIDHVRDISPLRALPGLVALKCYGTRGKMKFNNLSPLAGMSLNTLSVHNCEISNLSPLTGMPLKKLLVGNTNVRELAPLHECKDLTYIFARSTRVTVESADALKKALPNCKLEWDEPASR